MFNTQKQVGYDAEDRRAHADLPVNCDYLDNQTCCPQRLKARKESK